MKWIAFTFAVLLFCHPLMAGQGALGINDTAVWRNTADLDVAFKQYAESNTKYIRIGADWNVIEPVKGQYRQTYTDRLDYFFQKASDAGIHVLMIAAYAPEWANGGFKGSGYAPVDENAYADYCEWLLRRYAKYKSADGAHTLDAIEIWNEPDLSDLFFKPYNRNSIGGAWMYGKLVAAAGTRLKAVRKEIGADDVLICAPVLADTHTAAWSGWLDTFYATPGVTDCYDVFTWHSYWQSAGSTGWLPPELPPCFDAAAPQKGVMSKVTTDKGLIWPKMVAHGDDKKPNWCTEIGGAARSDAPDHKKRLISFDEQSAHLKDVIATLGSGKITNLQRVYWFNLFDNTSVRGDQPYYGIIACNTTRPIEYPQPISLANSTLTPKPAYAVYRDAAKTIPMASPETAAK